MKSIIPGVLSRIALMDRSVYYMLDLETPSVVNARKLKMYDKHFGFCHDVVDTTNCDYNHIIRPYMYRDAPEYIALIKCLIKGRIFNE